MSSEAITRNDLTNILNEVLPPTSSEYRKLLWTNPSPTSAFSAQTVTLDLSNYDEIEVICKSYATTTDYFTSRCKVNDGNGMLYSQTGGGSPVRIYGTQRKFTPTSTGVVFDNGLDFSASTSNVYCVPYQIYGIKYERVAQPQLEPNALIFRDYTLTPKNATYYEEDINIGVTGYTPISTFWNTNQAGLFIYNMRLKDKSTLNVGRSMDNGGALSSNYLYIKVAYLLDVLVGL